MGMDSRSIDDFIYCPYCFNSIKFLPTNSKNDRKIYLQKSGYNVLRLQSSDVIFDLSTDSHSAPVSNKQLASLNTPEHTPLGFGKSINELILQLSNSLNYPNFILTTQGRTAEFCLDRMLVKDGQIIPSNTTFISTQYHQKIHGGIPINISCEEASDFNSNIVFKGNLSVEKLERLLEINQDNISYISIELCSDAIGGYPVSLQNLKKIHDISRKYHIMVILDSTRILENALMIKEYEQGYEDWSIAKIVHEIGKYSDGCVLSLKKDFPTNIGGAIGIRSKELFYKLRDFNFNLGSDLPEEKIEAILIGIQELLYNDRYMKYRYSITQRLYNKLKESGIPTIAPCSSYGVWIDILEFIKHIPEYKNPHIALQNALYVEAGIRSSVSKIEMANGKKRWLMRLTLPHRLFTETHIDYIAQSIKYLYNDRFNIQGYFIEKGEPGIVGSLFSAYQPIKKVSSIGELFFRQVNRMKEKTAILITTSENTSSISYQQLGEYVKSFSKGLCYLGYQKGDRIGFLADNSLNSIISYIATASLGITDVPIYRTYSPVQIKNIILDAKIQCLIVSNGELLNKVTKIIHEVPWKVNLIIIDYDSDNEISDSFYTFRQVSKFGENVPMNEFEDRVQKVKSSDLLSIVYSSGTTGEPKGVMISHNSIVLTCTFKNYIYDLSESDMVLLQPRISHSFGRIFLFYVFNQGGSIGLLNTKENLLEQINLLKPTIITATPIFFENLYQLLTEKLSLPLIDQMPSKLDSKTLQSIRKNVGENVRFAISGGSSASTKILSFYKEINIPLLQSYGSTETCGIASETLSYQKMGTVGKIRPEIQYVITEEGELLIKSPYIIMGYYNNPSLTSNCFVKINNDIYYSTGDVVEIDREGYMRVIGRCVDSFSLSCGYNIQPQFIENLLCENELINDAFVFGEGEEFISALIVPNITVLKETLQRSGYINLLSLNKEDLLLTLESQDIFNKLIRSLDNKVAEPERVGKYKILSALFSKEKGEINENGKKQRRVIKENYKFLIESIYTKFKIVN